MSDIRERVDGPTTVRIAGLDAKAASLATIVFELEAIVADGVSAASAAVEEWRGAHAGTFVEEVNPFLVSLAVLVEDVRRAKQTLAIWPATPALLDTLTYRLDALDAAIAVPTTPADASARPDRLDDVGRWCASVAERVPTMTANVDLEGVTAQVTREIVDWSLDLGPVGHSPQVPVGPVLDPSILATAPRYETETSDPALHVGMPDLSGSVTALVEMAGRLASFTAGVAFAFRLCGGDGRLVELLMDHPSLADELLAGFTDGQIGAESALVILLAYFDHFDSAATGETDGLISMDDIWVVMADVADVPLHVREAAAVLSADPELFTLIETVNDSNQPSGPDTYGEVPGPYLGDGRMSRDDVELFLEFNDHLAVLDENFDAFADGAGAGSDGSISDDDLQALAEGGGELALTAAWLLAHTPLRDRVARHLDGGGSTTAITRDSLVVLAVDQHVYSDDPNHAAGFIDRSVGTLLGSPAVAASDLGMSELFGGALSESDTSDDVLQTVIAGVAAEGEIHHPALPPVFADGVAQNMDVIDSNVNTVFPRVDDAVPDGARENYFNTHDFVREVSRDPGAAQTIREAVFDHGQWEVQLADATGAERSSRLLGAGRVQALVNVAQDNSDIGAALDATDPPGASVGSATDYGIGHVPVAGDLNEVMDAMGFSAGDSVEWFVESMGLGGGEAATDVSDDELLQRAQDEFNDLSDADRRDRLRRAEAAISRSTWVALDRWGRDDALRQSADGQPFVDEHGRIKDVLSESEANAYREWVVNQSREGGLLADDVGELEEGTGEVYGEFGGLGISDRR